MDGEFYRTVIKVDAATFDQVGVLGLPSGEKKPHDFVYKDGYLCVITAEELPSTIHKINLATFTLVKSFNLTI